MEHLFTLSLFGNFYVDLFGIEVRLSLVDIFMVCLAYFCIGMQWRRSYSCILGLAGIAVVHSLFINVADTGLLIKETFKLCYMAVGIILLSYLFEKVRTTTSLYVLVSMAALTAAGLHYHYGENFVPPVTIAALLLFMLFYNKNNTIHALFSAVTWLFIAENQLEGLMIPLIISICMPYARMYKNVLAGAALFVCMFVGLFALTGIKTNIVSQSGVQSRVEMAASGTKSISNNLLGIGMGQVPAGYVDRMKEKGWTNRTSLHNTPLSLMVWLGIFSIPFFIFGLWLAVESYKSMDVLSWITIGSIMGVLCLTHDLFGVQSFWLMIAYLLHRTKA